MRNTWLVPGLVMLLVAFVPGTLDAQEGGKVTLEAGGGIAVPTSDLADIAEAGPTVGAWIGYRLHPRVAVGVGGELDLLSGKDAEGDAEATPAIELWRALGGVEYRAFRPSSSLSVRVQASGGITSFNTDVFPEIVFDPRSGDPVGDFSETYPTVSGGIEVGYTVNPTVDVLIGSAWTLMLTDEDETAIFQQMRPEVEGFDQASTVPVTLRVEVNL